MNKVKDFNDLFEGYKNIFSKKSPNTNPRENQCSERTLFPSRKKINFLNSNKENLSVLNNLVPNNKDIGKILSKNIQGINSVAINNGFSSRTFDNSSASPVLAKKHLSYQKYKRLSQNLESIENEYSSSGKHYAIDSQQSQKSVKNQPVYRGEYSNGSNNKIKEKDNLSTENISNNSTKTYEIFSPNLNKNDVRNMMMSRINWLLKLKDLYDKLKRLSKNNYVKKHDFLDRFRKNLQFFDLFDAKVYKENFSEQGFAVYQIENKIAQINHEILSEDLLLNSIMFFGIEDSSKTTGTKFSPISQTKHKMSNLQEKTLSGTFESSKRMTTESKKMSTFFYDYEEDDVNDDVIEEIDVENENGTSSRRNRVENSYSQKICLYIGDNKIDNCGSRSDRNHYSASKLDDVPSTDRNALSKAKNGGLDSSSKKMNQDPNSLEKERIVYSAKNNTFGSNLHSEERKVKKPFQFIESLIKTSNYKNNHQNSTNLTNSHIEQELHKISCKKNLFSRRSIDEDNSRNDESTLLNANPLKTNFNSILNNVLNKGNDKSIQVKNSKICDQNSTIKKSKSEMNIHSNNKKFPQDNILDKPSEYLLTNIDNSELS